MKYIVALLMVGLLAAASRGAAAQEVLTPPSGAGDLPPTMSDELSDGQYLDGGETIDPAAETYAEGADESFSEYGGDPMYLQSSCPSLFESSGSWLRRGFWFAEGDYMLINRSWDRKGMLFAFEGGTSTSPGAIPNGLGTPGFGQVLAINTVEIAGSKPGADGMARFTLGRFLFRDVANRDHTVQATYFGGGNFAQSSDQEAASSTGWTVNDFIDRVNPSFDGAERIAFDYETTIDSIEGNYVVKSRMGRDQMVLHPNGDWVREAQTSITLGYLAGLRYMNLTDELNIVADIDPDVVTSEGGFYNVDTDNNLFGGQLGVSIARETARWSVGATAKGGSYWNRMFLDSRFRAGPSLIPSVGVTDVREDNLSFVGEFQLLGKYHLRPNLSLRAGLEILYIDSVALGPSQVNFVPGGYPPIADDGDVFCLGSSLGIEAYR